MRARGGLNGDHEKRASESVADAVKERCIDLGPWRIQGLGLRNQQRVRVLVVHEDVVLARGVVACAWWLPVLLQSAALVCVGDGWLMMEGRKERNHS